jgi:signal transduction histidine kinase
MIESRTTPLIVLLVGKDGTDSDLIAQRIRNAAPDVPVVVVTDGVARLESAARDRAVSTISHDLRNPLSTIQICASALLDPVPLSAEGVRQTAELIQRSAVWMQQTISTIDKSAG